METLANSAVFWVFVIVAAAALYMLPTIIGLIRHVDGLALVVLLNLLGWIGWLAALILAFGPRRTPPPRPVAPYPPPIVLSSPHVVVLSSAQWPIYGPTEGSPPQPWYGPDPL